LTGPLKQTAAAGLNLLSFAKIRAMRIPALNGYKVVIAAIAGQGFINLCIKFARLF